MLSKDITFRFSAKILLRLINEYYPEIFIKNQTQTEVVRKQMPKGIFDYFIQMKLSDFLNEIEFDTSDSRFETSFCLATSNFQKDIPLEKNQIYLFHFTNRQIKLHEYLIKTSHQDYPTGWKLEIFIEGKKLGCD